MDASTSTAASCGYGPAPEGYSYPTGPYGNAVGQKFEGFELEDCDGNSVSFADVLAHGELALVTIGAGWCPFCNQEAAGLEAEYHTPFCGQGLRIVQVLFQDTNYKPAGREFCRAWRAKYGLTMPVLIDPNYSTKKFFAGDGTPLILLVDSDGVIRLRTSHTVPDLRGRIAALLAQ